MLSLKKIFYNPCLHFYTNKINTFYLMCNILYLLTLSQGGHGGKHGKNGGAGHGSGHGRTGAGHGEHPPPGHTEQGLRSLQEATHGFVVYG